MGPLIASSPSSIQENSQTSGGSLCGSLNSASGLPSLNPIDIRQFPQNSALWNELMEPDSTVSSLSNPYLQHAPLMVKNRHLKKDNICLQSLS